ncbi:MAG: D-aminoacyl-tRNA deacylase, partial [Candidatus Nezhaarchaeales archaeon]
VVAQAIAEILEVKDEGEVAVGFGGPHYAPQFNRIVLNEDIAISHIIPKYAFPHVTKREVMLAIERSMIKPIMALIDWKGLKSDERQLVLNVCNEAGIQVRKI